MPCDRDAPVEIVGAGPAGLAAALAVVRAGRRAVLWERRRRVGARFHGDFQGLENWSDGGDVLDELAALGIAADFDHAPVHEVTVYAPDGTPRRFQSARPLFYLVRRGSEAGTLDHALLGQALAAGVEVRFGQARPAPRCGIVGHGPRRADALALGYLFETDAPDGCHAVVSEALAPGGYAYLLVQGGRGTLATCLFRHFERAEACLAASVAFFDRHVPVRRLRPRRFGGVGNFALPRRVRHGDRLLVGEAAGLQDPLFGFGIRTALRSGAAAGAALAGGDPAAWQRYWRRHLRPVQQVATVNRWLYERLGDRGYAAVLARYPAGQDVREWLGRAYRPRLARRLLYHLLARRRFPPLPAG